MRTASTTYTYDLAGNLHIVEQPTGQRTTTTWDDQNRQTGVLLPTGAIVTNTYRFDGLRHSKQEPQRPRNSFGTSTTTWPKPMPTTKSKPFTPTSHNRTATSSANIAKGQPSGFPATTITMPWARRGC
jgi:YD repeat-containing protein